MHPLSNKGIDDMTELDCLRALVVKHANGATLNGKRLNEMNELDCWRALVIANADL